MDVFAFASLPFWLVFAISSAILIIFSELGFRLGRRRSHQQPAGGDGSFGVATAALLGLVTFLLAFTFSIAASQFADRRAAVLEEANILGTAYTRAQLLPDEAAEQLTGVLDEYIALRVDAAERGTPIAEYIRIIEESVVLHGQMWATAKAVAKSDPTAVNALVLDALNEVFDIHTERVAYAFHRRIPPVIWMTLLLVAGTATGAMTYRAGALWEQRPELTPALIFAFAGMVTLIADLDNPRKGFLTGDQNPILELGAEVLN